MSWVKNFLISFLSGFISCIGITSLKLIFWSFNLLSLCQSFNENSYLKYLLLTTLTSHKISHKNFLLLKSNSQEFYTIIKLLIGFLSTYLVGVGSNLQFQISLLSFNLQFSKFQLSISRKNLFLWSNNFLSNFDLSDQD